MHACISDNGSRHDCRCRIGSDHTHEAWERLGRNSAERNAPVGTPNTGTDVLDRELEALLNGPELSKEDRLREHLSNIINNATEVSNELQRLWPGERQRADTALQALRREVTLVREELGL